MAVVAGGVVLAMLLGSTTIVLNVHLSTFIRRLDVEHFRAISLIRIGVPEE